MKLYTLRVRGNKQRDFDDPLEFETTDFIEAMSIIEIMMKHGHRVQIESTEMEEPKEEPARKRRIPEAE